MKILKNVLGWVLDRLKEKSTWLALFAGLATILGVELQPELKEAIITAGMAVVSAVAIGVAEQK